MALPDNHPSAREGVMQREKVEPFHPQDGPVQEHQNRPTAGRQSPLLQVEPAPDDPSTTPVSKIMSFINGLEVRLFPPRSKFLSPHHIPHGPVPKEGTKLATQGLHQPTEYGRCGGGLPPSNPPFPG